MAEEQRLLKGLFKDSGEIDQPKDTWRYAINALMNEQKGAVSNESGTDIAGYIPCEGCSVSGNRNHTHEYKIIGAIEINLNRTILFVADKKDLIIDTVDISNNYYPRHSIILWDDVKRMQDKARIIYRPVTDPGNSQGYYPFDLNFKTTNPIEGIFRIDSKEDIIIYWTDDLNPPRAFNISRQLRYLDNSVLPSFNQIHWLYGINPLTTHNKHIGLLNLFPASGPIPKINSDFPDDSFSTIGEGGGLLTGVYYLAVAYVDEDFVSTNYLTISNPVSIVPGYSHTRPTTKNDGAKPGTQTSKSITWNIQNLNTDYKYLKSAVIRKNGDAIEVFKLTDKTITGDISLFTNRIQISFAGTEGFEPLRIEDVLIDTVGYDTSKTITQMDGILYMGNLKGSPDLGYQKYANNIKLNAHKKPIEDFDPVVLSVDNIYSGFGNTPVDSLGIGGSQNTINDKSSYRDPDMITYYRGYRRGEVYAFYISFILNDGSMSYAYHIPGREPIQAPPIWPELYEATFGNPSSPILEYEYEQIPTTHVGSNPAVQDQISLHAGVKIFHFYDVSMYTNGTDANSRSSGISRNMSYWHNANETYPHTDNSQVWDRNTYIDNNGALQSQVVGYYNTCSTCNYSSSGGLQGMFIRHHHMPSNNNPWAKTIEEDPVGMSQGAQEIDLQAPGFRGTFRAATSSHGGFWLSSSASATRSCHGGTGWPLNSAFNVNYVTPSTPSDSVPWSSAKDKFIATHANTIVNMRCRWQCYNENSCCLRETYIKAYSKEYPGAPTKHECTAYWDIPHKRVRDLECSSSNINLQVGGEIWFEAHAQQCGTCVDCGSCSKTCKKRMVRPLATNNSYVEFDVTIGSGLIDSYDTSLTHDVNILGISLEDINIPKSYYDKIQGFRIYYAKRDYNNKRILGQAPLIPMTTGIGKIGVCKEALAYAGAQGSSGAQAIAQGLSVASDLAEPWRVKEAWAKEPHNYFLTPTYKSSQNSRRLYQVAPPGAGSNYLSDFEVHAYKYFTFYDFNMIREHIGLSAATHIDPVYVSNNWVWNGPTTQQERKMLSELDMGGNTSDDTGLYKVTERWGWDILGSEQSCWAQNTKTALFVGGKYITSKKFMGTTYTLPRLLSQKAKTYINGDTVLLANPLGFGGKIINTFGDSALIFAIKDKVELPALYASPTGLLNQPASISTAAGLPSTGYPAGYFLQMLGSAQATTCVYGVDPYTQYGATEEFPWLANPNLYKSTYKSFYILSEGETEPEATLNLSYIINLCAFKTDMYRSVDNQELVWTGFQIVGEDLNNFFFEDEKRIIDYSDPLANSYGSLVPNLNFGQQWRADIRPFTSPPIITISGDGVGAAATAVIDTAGTLTSITITGGGAGYTTVAISITQAVSNIAIPWITLTPTLTAGVLTAISVAYPTNTFKIETGECTSFCSNSTYVIDDKETCETGACYGPGDMLTLYNSGYPKRYDDNDKITGTCIGAVGTTPKDCCINGGGAWTSSHVPGLYPIQYDFDGSCSTTTGVWGAPLATPITGTVSCSQHGKCRLARYVAGIPIWKYSAHGLTNAECTNLVAGYSGWSVVAWEPYTWIGGGGVFAKDCGGIYGGDVFIARHGISTGVSVLEETRTSMPEHGIHYQIVESEDNINFRHTENQDSAYFPNDIATDIFKTIGGISDPNTQDTTLYDKNYSSVNDIKTAIPLPIKNTDQDSFPTRTIRSTKNDTSGIIDNYRIWLANQFRDLPKHRGELWKLSVFNNLIYFHMEQSLFKAAGKQTMQMGDGSDAYVGSGDIFKQEPTEIIQTKDGYGGTQSQYAALTTRYGYFFVDRKGKKVFIMKDKLMEISSLGMENWFIDNMNYDLIAYGATELDKIDNPIEGLGYHSVWDPYNKRIILTKRDLEPTQAFINGFNLPPGGGGLPQIGKIIWSSTLKCFVKYTPGGFVIFGGGGPPAPPSWNCISWDDEYFFTKGGWTLSYYPDLGVWASFHSYVPYIYFNTTETFYSITDHYYHWTGIGDTLYPDLANFMQTFGTNVGNKGIWKHNTGAKGLLYQDNVFGAVASPLTYQSHVKFELEVIQNSLKAMDTLTSSIGFMLDVYNDNNSRVLEHGFTSFYVYNTFQISGDETSSPLEYLINTRRVGNMWKINRFRDMSDDIVRGPVGPQADPYYMSTSTNILGGTNTGTQTTRHNLSMFSKTGMVEFVIPGYLNLAKTTLQRRKFIDKWIGIRLIYDNITNNLLNLYSTSVEARKMYR